MKVKFQSNLHRFSVQKHTTDVKNPGVLALNAPHNRLWLHFYSVFTHHYLLVLHNACIEMYADDSTIYSAESSIKGLIKNLALEMKSAIEWISSNKIVLMY